MFFPGTPFFIFFKILFICFERRKGEKEGEYSIGNGLAKELIHLTHGHEQWCGDCLREWGCWVEEGNRGNIGTTVIALKKKEGEKCRHVDM